MQCPTGSVQEHQYATRYHVIITTTATSPPRRPNSTPKREPRENQREKEMTSLPAITNPQESSRNLVGPHLGRSEALVQRCGRRPSVAQHHPRPRLRSQAQGHPLRVDEVLHAPWSIAGGMAALSGRPGRNQRYRGNCCGHGSKQGGAHPRSM